MRCQRGVCSMSGGLEIIAPEALAREHVAAVNPPRGARPAAVAKQDMGLCGLRSARDAVRADASDGDNVARMDTAD